jgi:hypothetical protein
VMDDIPPIKTFDAGDRIYVRAQQVWLILVAFVMSRQEGTPRTLTYGDLAEKMGYDRRAGVGLGRGPLGIVGEYCLLNNLPTMNSIVVNNTGFPGDHVLLRGGYTVAQEQEETLGANWFQFRVPTTGTFRKVREIMRLNT